MRALRTANRTETSDSEDSEAIALFGLEDRLSRSDRALLSAAMRFPVDVDVVVPTPSAYAVLWLQHFKLIVSWVDASDRMWIRTTTAGALLIAGPRKRDRRTDMPRRGDTP